MKKSFKVRARPGVLVPVPKLAGAVAQYVGRDVAHAEFANTQSRFDGMAHHPSSIEEDHEVLYPISEEPTTVSVQSHGFHVYEAIARAVRDGDLLLVEDGPRVPMKTQPEAGATAESE